MTRLSLITNPSMHCFPSDVCKRREEVTLNADEADCAVIDNFKKEKKHAHIKPSAFGKIINKIKR